MEEGVGEECGVSAIYLKDHSKSDTSVPSYLIAMNQALQHRGQKSSGISVYNPNGRSRLVSYKDLGLVSQVFRVSEQHELEKILDHCQGVAGIGHTRYSTSGNRKDVFAARDEVQPFERRHGKLWKRFSIAFNGNVANYDELKTELIKDGYWLDTEVDTEILMNLISLNLKRLSKDGGMNPNLFEVAKNIMVRLDGAYNVVSMFGDGNLLAFRDPLGIRPMVWGESDRFYALASESTALNRIGIKDFRDVQPGEAIIFNQKGVSQRRLVESPQRLCQFEFVYFAKADSVIDGTHVKKSREKLGVELAKVEPLLGRLDPNYVVVPAPWTAITAAETYAETLGLRIRIAIEKDERLRGFINESYERKRIMNNVYRVHSSDVEGRKVILFDDSLVRGETSKILVSKVREAGASEVHLRLTEPPIVRPCFYGVDFPDMKELIANHVKGDFEQEVARLIGADSVVFQNLQGLERALGKNGNLCTACIGGEYPTPCGKKLYERQIAGA